jgi:hypothetical protein
LVQLRSLQQSGFAVFEDEVPQRILAFNKTYDRLQDPFSSASTDVDSTAGVRARDPRVGKDSPTRTYLVCVDSLHTSFSDVDAARRALIKFFQKEHDDRAQYALMSLGRQIEVIQDSTRDPSLVFGATVKRLWK